MKTKIIRSLTTFIITTSIMAATTINFATAQTSQKENNLFNISNYDKNAKYYGNYIIGDETINKYISDLLNSKNVKTNNDEYNEEFSLIKSSIQKSDFLQEDLFGELVYTLNDKKLIIHDISGGETFVMDYEIKDNILYGKVYNFSEEMALGHFQDNGNFLIVNAPHSKANSIYLEHHTS
jgi:hypothetical protein